MPSEIAARQAGSQRSRSFHRALGCVMDKSAAQELCDMGSNSLIAFNRLRALAGQGNRGPRDSRYISIALAGFLLLQSLTAYMQGSMALAGLEALAGSEALAGFAFAYAKLNSRLMQSS